MTHPEHPRDPLGSHQRLQRNPCGHLQIGEIAIAIAVSAAHRDAAFDACRAIIDSIKSTVPIWKKEHYTDGTSIWVKCHACAEHGH